MKRYRQSLSIGAKTLLSHVTLAVVVIALASVISYTPEGLATDAPAVQALAQAEGLWAHALSVGMRRRLVEQGAESFADPIAACEDAMATAWPRTLDAPGVPNLSGAGE